MYPDATAVPYAPCARELRARAFLNVAQTVFMLLMVEDTDTLIGGPCRLVARAVAACEGIGVRRDREYRLRAGPRRWILTPTSRRR